MGKDLPIAAPVLTPKRLKDVTDKLNSKAPESPYEEIDRQNRELLKTLQELRARQEELALLNRELEDTNRGVVALYAELDERADYLRRASDLKTSFLSNISHEFRTPLIPLCLWRGYCWTAWMATLQATRKNRCNSSWSPQRRYRKW